MNWINKYHFYSNWSQLIQLCLWLQLSQWCKGNFIFIVHINRFIELNNWHYKVVLLCICHHIYCFLWFSTLRWLCIMYIIIMHSVCRTERNESNCIIKLVPASVFELCICHHMKISCTIAFHKLNNHMLKSYHEWYH